MQRYFDWDLMKETRNRQKHGVAFQEAVTIFYDPYILSRYDDDHSQAEDRWVAVGESSLFRLLLVVFVVLEDVAEWESIRIISARKATSRETDTYRSRRPL